MRYTRISADCHLDLIWLPPDLFTANASAAMRDRMPYVTDGPKGPIWVSKKGAQFGLVNGMGSAGREYVPGQIHRSDRMASTGLYDDGRRGVRRLTDPHLRLKDQERDGVQAEVLYGILGTSDRLQDPEAAAEVMRIYNEWLADFCGAHPERYAGLACIPSLSVEAAVAEIERVAKRGGARGIEVANSHDMPALYDPVWEPLWGAAHAAGLPVHFHTIGGKRPDWSSPAAARGPRRLRHPHHRIPAGHGQCPHGGDLRRGAGALSPAQDRHRRERHRLDPLHPRPHGPRVGGPVQGSRALDAAERLLAAAVQGHLPDRPHRHHPHRRAGRRDHHVGLGLPPSRRHLARLAGVHRPGARPSPRATRRKVVCENAGRLYGFIV